MLIFLCKCRMSNTNFSENKYIQLFNWQFMTQIQEVKSARNSFNHFESDFYHQNSIFTSKKPSNENFMCTENMWQKVCFSLIFARSTTHWIFWGFDESLAIDASVFLSKKARDQSFCFLPVIEKVIHSGQRKRGKSSVHYCIQCLFHLQLFK